MSCGRNEGKEVNGKELDSSHGGVATFKISGVIKGWREALQLMPVGSKWQVVVPPDLAYGELGMGRVIMLNTTLIFELELVGIKPAAVGRPPSRREAATWSTAFYEGGDSGQSLSGFAPGASQEPTG